MSYNNSSASHSGSTENLKHSIQNIANVELYDESNGLFGEMIPPEIVLQGLLSHSSDNVGRLDDPTAAKATQAIHSFTCHSSSREEEVVLQFDNATLYPVRVRWLDEFGRSFDHYNFTLEALASTERYSRLGHLFLMTVVLVDDGTTTTTATSTTTAREPEWVLGAYRIRMALPSQSPHSIRIEQTGGGDDQYGGGGGGGNGDTTTTIPINNSAMNITTSSGPGFIVESVLSDRTGHDALVVAAEALDAVGAGSNHDSMAKTIKTLSTVVGNLRNHPDEPKYHSLRLSNPKIQHQIVSCWGAMQLLSTIGFRRTRAGRHPTVESSSNTANNNNADAPAVVTRKIQYCRQYNDQQKTEENFVTAEQFQPYQLNGGLIAAVSGKDFVVVASDTRFMGESGYDILSRSHVESRLWMAADDSRPLSLQRAFTYEPTSMETLERLPFSVQGKALSKIQSFILPRSPAFVGAAGCNADCEALKRIVQADLRSAVYFGECSSQSHPPPDQVANLLSQILYSRRSSPFYSFCIVAGLLNDDNYNENDSNGGCGRVYVYDVIGSYEQVAVACTGTGRELLQPILDGKFATIADPPKGSSECMRISTTVPTQVDCTAEEAISTLIDGYRSVSEREIGVGDNVVICVLRRHQQKQGVECQVFIAPLKQH